MNMEFPEYAIYGEPVTHIPDSYFHFEDAHDIACENGWDFKPHVHAYLYQMIWVKHGDGVFSGEGKKVKFDGNWVVFIAPNTLHSVKFAENSKVWSLYFTLDFMNLGAMGNMLMDFLGNISRPMYKSVHIPEKNRHMWSDLFHNVKQEYEKPHVLGHKACIKSWVALLLTQLVRIEDDTTAPHILTQSMTRSEATTNRFLQLVEQYYAEHHRIYFYAKQMHISPDTLNNHVKLVMGRTVGKILRDRLVLEAKRQLIYAELSVKQVAKNLNFEDPSYFVRFFKREIGIPPKAYKTQQGKINKHPVPNR